MEIRKERQLSPVADEVSALIAVTRPIIAGLLHSIAEEHLEVHGGRKKLLLKNIGRVRKSSDGDLGVAFEYAVHDAINRHEESVIDRVETALRVAKIRGGSPDSILSAIEKSGSKQLIDTRRDLITPDSQLMTGRPGRPIKLQAQLNNLSAAFRRPQVRTGLPKSINGLWKADLFLGSAASDRWLGATVKVNPRSLEAANGLRVAIVPSSSNKSDAVKKDEAKNLIVCPIPYDPSFMLVFYEGMRIVQSLVRNDFNMPKDVELPAPSHRETARVYVERREYSVEDVLEATSPYAQPHLLETKPEDVMTETIDLTRQADTETAIGPLPSFY
ncbi:hypothetical protein [Corynebacterium sp. AOP12-C2-36]|uniref:hypothetical protein n=1 Tax=Corynebacterium sp. AOP12-C2-36 TaxID=3457723 RepID=UPI004034DEDD